MINKGLKFVQIWYHIDGLVQDCSNSIPNALESLQSCTKPLIYDILFSPHQSCHDTLLMTIVKNAQK